MSALSGIELVQMLWIAVENFVPVRNAHPLPDALQGPLIINAVKGL